MSIGFLKKLLALGNLVGVLAIGGAAYGFWSHRGELRETFEPPTFRKDVLTREIHNPNIRDISMPLGAPMREVEQPKAEKAPEKKEEIETALARLGEIKTAAVLYPPYEGLYPTIIFKYHKPPAGQEEIRTIRLGEALVSKPHPRDENYPVPVRYKFIRCEPDPEHPGWTYFVFDMNCDGKDIQKARWKLEEEEAEGLPAASGEDAPDVRTMSSKGFSLRRPGDLDEPEEVEPVTPDLPRPPQPERPEPVTTQPEPFRGDLFVSESGTFEPTREGLDYLKDNYNDLIGDARTTTWNDPNTGRPAGIKISAIRKGSLANSFGLLEDDVILEVNGRPVTSKSQAVSVVRGELEKTPRPDIIRVTVLRFGIQKELRFDTRDPDTIREAKRHMR